MLPWAPHAAATQLIGAHLARHALTVHFVAVIEGRAHRGSHRGGELDEAGVKVLARQHLQVLVQQLAALEVAVVEVDHHPLCLRHNLQEVPLLHLH